MDQILESDRGFEPYYQPASYHHLHRHGAGRHRLLRQDPGTTLRKADAVLRRQHSHLPSLFRGRARHPRHGDDELPDAPHGPEGARSEEHTSELQSLMRTSYAVL